MYIATNYPYVLDAFIAIGVIYFTIGTIDYIRWWNGSDENGNPK